MALKIDLGKRLCTAAKCSFILSNTSGSMDESGFISSLAMAFRIYAQDSRITHMMIKIDRIPNLPVVSVSVIPQSR